MSKQKIDENLLKKKKMTKRRLKNDNNLQTVDEKKVKSDDNMNEISGQTSVYFERRKLNINPDKISIDFFRVKSCIDLAKALLGQILCRRLSPNGAILKGKIVETESYIGGEDQASNSFNGRRTEANEPMFMSSGTCYVYMTYGMYYCFNISSEGFGSAVLLRAVQPLEGIDFMRQFRSRARKTNCDKEFKLKELTNGPSKLCMAFDINKNNTNKVDITNSDEIWLQKGDTVCETNIIKTKRIGIKRAGLWNDKPFRFYIKDSEFVSQK